MKNYSIIDRCPITSSPEKIKYFDLGNIPLVNNLCETRDKSLSVEKYPLDINYFPLSGESSLSIAINGDLLFSHYLFKSEVNVPYYEHCKEMFRYSQNYIKNKKDIKIIDIGGNDGTLLDAFRSLGGENLSLLNIDPSKNLCEICLNKNIPVLNEFFSKEISLKIKDKVDIITSTNVFQHLLDINSFAEGVEYLLKDDGIWILEFPYWLHDMNTNQFDQIYHEHVYYHSVKPMKMMMEKHNMKIINVTKQNIHGGTLRLIIAKDSSKFKPDFTIDAYLEYEKKFDISYHMNWGYSVKKHIQKSSDLIKSLVRENKKIFGFGAAAKGCIYLNTMNIDYNQIEYIIDDTDIKQNKFIPGTGIEVVSRDILKENKPDYILILAHNFKEHIIDSLKGIYDGKFIVLVPEIEIL